MHDKGKIRENEKQLQLDKCWKGERGKRMDLLSCEQKSAKRNELKSNQEEGESGKLHKESKPSTYICTYLNTYLYTQNMFVCTNNEQTNHKMQMPTPTRHSNGRRA